MSNNTFGFPSGESEKIKSSLKNLNLQKSPDLLKDTPVKVALDDYGQPTIMPIEGQLSHRDYFCPLTTAPNEGFTNYLQGGSIQFGDRVLTAGYPRGSGGNIIISKVAQSGKIKLVGTVNVMRDAIYGSIHKIDEKRFFYQFYSNSNGQHYGLVYDFSDDKITTNQTPTLLSAFQSANSTVNIGNNKFVVLGRDTTTGYIFARVVQVNTDSSLTLGTINNSTYAINATWYQALNSDYAGGNQIIVTYLKTTSYYIYAFCLTFVDNNTLTFNAEVAVSSVYSSSPNVQMLKMVNTFLFTYGNNAIYCAKIGTLSGTTISLGAELSLGGNDAYSQQKAYALPLNDTLVWVLYPTGSGKHVFCPCSISGTTLTKGTETYGAYSFLDATANYGFLNPVMIKPNCYVICANYDTPILNSSILTTFEISGTQVYFAFYRPSTTNFAVVHYPLSRRKILFVYYDNAGTYYGLVIERTSFGCWKPNITYTIGSVSQGDSIFMEQYAPNKFVVITFGLYAFCIQVNPINNIITVLCAPTLITSALPSPVAYTTKIAIDDSQNVFILFDTGWLGWFSIVSDAIVVRAKFSQSNIDSTVAQMLPQKRGVVLIGKQTASSNLEIDVLNISKNYDLQARSYFPPSCSISASDLQCAWGNFERTKIVALYTNVTEKYITVFNTSGNGALEAFTRAYDGSVQSRAPYNTIYNITMLSEGIFLVFYRSFNNNPQASVITLSNSEWSVKSSILSNLVGEILPLDRVSYQGLQGFMYEYFSRYTGTIPTVCFYSVGDFDQYIGVWDGRQVRGDYEIVETKQKLIAGLKYGIDKQGQLAPQTERPIGIAKSTNQLLLIPRRG